MDAAGRLSPAVTAPSGINPIGPSIEDAHALPGVDPENPPVLTPEQEKERDRMLAEMEGMSEAERRQLPSLGIDPDIMKSTMKMMKDNPAMLQSMGQMMENMTPDQVIAEVLKKA